MHYSEILQYWEPVETGNFMLRFYIKEREYIIYSPNQNCISCLELSTFNDLTPFQLAAVVQSQKFDNTLEEFKFQWPCSKENLIAYLFDIETANGQCLKRHVSTFKGYFLYDVLSPFKIKNLYQFNPENREFQLLFDNDFCCTSINKDVHSEHMVVTWNPYIFHMLEIGHETNYTFLLPATNLILFSYVYEILKGLEEQRLHLYLDGNVIEALLFVALYIEAREKGRKIKLERNNKYVTVHFLEWNPIEIMNFISNVQKKCNEQLFKIYNTVDEESVKVFQLYSIDEKKYVIFPNSSIFVSTFLKMLIKELNIEDLSYSELALSNEQQH